MKTFKVRYYPNSPENENGYTKLTELELGEVILLLDKDGIEGLRKGNPIFASLSPKGEIEVCSIPKARLSRPTFKAVLEAIESKSLRKAFLESL